MRECNVKPTPYDKTPDVNIIIWPLNPIKTSIIATNRGLEMRKELKEWPQQDYSPSNLIVLAPKTPLKDKPPLEIPLQWRTATIPWVPVGGRLNEQLHIINKCTVEYPCVNWRGFVEDIWGMKVCSGAKLSPLGQQLMLLLTRLCWRTTHTITAGIDATILPCTLLI